MAKSFVYFQGRFKGVKSIVLDTLSNLKTTIFDYQSYFKKANKHTKNNKATTWLSS